MTPYRLAAATRFAAPASGELADIVEQEWLAAHPGDTVVRRHLGTDPIPADAWPLAVSAGQTPAPDRSPQQRQAAALAATLVDELLAADAIVLAVPLYNFGVSQHIKAWIDLIVTDPRAGAGAPPLLAGEARRLATGRGGRAAAAGGQARRPGHGPGRRLRPRHPARGLGPLDRLPHALPGHGLGR